MAETSDILLIAGLGFALMQVKGIFGGVGDVCLNPLGCGDRETTRREEITVTEKFSCTCSDGFKMESETGDCIADCEVTGHGTKESIIGEYYTCPNGSRLPSQNRTYAQTCGCPDGYTLDNNGQCTRIVGIRDTIISRKVACPDGKVIDITGMDAPTSDAFIKKQCGLDCPPPYFSLNGECVTSKPTHIPSNIQQHPVNVIYGDISSGEEVFREKDPEPKPELAKEWRSEYEF